MIIGREVYHKIKPYIHSPEAIVITGMRRSGKTTLIKYVYDQIDSKNKLFVDLENPLNQKYFEEENYEKIKFNFELLGLNFSKQGYLFLDEIQFIKNLPSVVKYLFDHYRIKFFLTGSSSFYLKNLFSESLAGRKYIFELFPFNFKEFLTLKNEKISLPTPCRKISHSIFNTFAKLYEEYLLFGGFPGVINKPSIEEKKMALSDIFSSYFQLEVIQLGDYRKVSAVRDLILLLMQRAGSKLDIQKLSLELKISRPTIYEYLSFLEGTYFIKLIKPYSRSRDVEIRGGEKVYICDSGILNNLARVSEGSLFENNIFQNLRTKGEVNYYQKGASEIDFILNKKQAFEVKITPTNQDLDKLRKITKDLRLKKFNLVGKNFSDLENVIYGFLI